jgi:2-keto-4-pentenoate hydratase/2-oxohepta-3-ene-1,7-dioic acid hydratase in catechol pathway
LTGARCRARSPAVPADPVFENPAAPRLATVVVRDEPRLAVAVAGRVVDLAAALPEAPTTMSELIADWPRWRDPVRALGEDAATCDFDGFAPPVAPAKLICVGANYHDHVAEMTGPAGVEVTVDPFPFGFLKPPTALAGSGRPVTLPGYATKVDWEAELAIVIGDGRLASGDDPLGAVFGYTILNDLSVRDFLPFPHALGLDAIVAKGFDGAAPIGPWITLAEDVADPGALPIRLRVNGTIKQDSSTAQLIFGLREIVAHYGRVLTLEPGDVIATGTPAGVGAARSPQEFLADGDVVEITIGDLGTLSTPVTVADRQLSLTIDR